MKPKKYYKVTTLYQVEQIVLVEAKNEKEANKLVSENGTNCNECIRVMDGNVHGMISCDEDAEECTEWFEDPSLSFNHKEVA